MYGEDMSRNLKTIVALTLSFALHFALFRFLGSLSYDSNSKIAARQSLSKVAIHIAHTTKLRQAEPRKFAKTPQVHAEQPMQKQATKNHKGESIAAQKPSISGYETLLPGPDWQSSTDINEGNDPRDLRRGSPQAIKAATLIQGRFYIPLTWRKSTDDGHAFGKLTRRSENEIVINFIDGDPMSRAVLFEGLRAPDVWPGLLDLFAALETKELLFSLSYVRKLSLTGKSAHDFSVKVRGIKISIADTLFQEGGPSGEASQPKMGIGTTLPDALAERSMQHDASDADKLRRSIAYNAPVRDYVLKAPEEPTVLTQ